MDLGEIWKAAIDILKWTFRFGVSILDPAVASKRKYDWGMMTTRGCPKYLLKQWPWIHMVYLPSETLVMTNTAIEICQRNSGFTQLENGGSFHSYVSLPEANHEMTHRNRWFTY